MIVRDEAHVIEETLAAVAPRIDTWVIVDTGSIHATQEVVKRFFVSRGIPGELHERPWVDFGANRTEALALCRGKADYAWVIDALTSERDAGARRVTLRTRGPVAAP
jgi:glycosyltransferase involved in cell wall biosynthesis